MAFLSSSPLSSSEGAEGSGLGRSRVRSLGGEGEREEMTVAEEEAVVAIVSVSRQL